MLSNIEQAVTSLLASNKAITVSNVFSAYMTIAGIRELDTDSAVATFERAMDKHAPRPAVVQSPMIVQLRNQYWYTKLGGCGKGEGMCQQCGRCGGSRFSRQRSIASTPTIAATTQVVGKAHETVRRGETVCSTSILSLTRDIISETQEAETRASQSGT